MKKNIIFREVLKEKFTSKCDTNFIEPILGVLDDVIRCIDKYKKVNVADVTETLEYYIEESIGRGFISKEKYIELFLDQIIWLNLIIEKEIYSSDSKEFGVLYDYACDISEKELWEYYNYHLSAVRADETLKFYDREASYFEESNIYIFVTPKKIEKLLIDLSKVLSEKVEIDTSFIATLTTKPVLKEAMTVNNEIKPVDVTDKKTVTANSKYRLKEQALINIYVGKNIFTLDTAKGKQHLSFYRNKSNRVKDLDNENKNEKGKNKGKKNKPHETLLNKVITYLKENKYDSAYKMAGEELKEFRKNNYKLFPKIV